MKTIIWTGCIVHFAEIVYHLIVFPLIASFWHMSLQSIEFQNDLTYHGTEKHTFLTQVNEITAILFYSVMTVNKILLVSLICISTKKKENVENDQKIFERIEVWVELWTKLMLVSNLKVKQRRLIHTTQYSYCHLENSLDNENMV